MNQKNLLLRETYEMLTAVLNSNYRDANVSTLRYRIAKNLKITPSVEV